MAVTRRTGNPSADRVSYPPVDGAAELFTPAFLDYLVRLHDEFTPRVRALRAARAAVLQRALQHGILPALAPSAVTSGCWRVPPVPADLLRPAFAISGACSLARLVIT